MSRFTGEYTEDWEQIARRVKEEAGWSCVRCRHPHDPKHGYCLTVHHLDGDKANNRWYNLAALCQRCHLRIQAKVIMQRPWMLEHTPWFKPFAAAYYAATILKVELTREQVAARMDDLLALGQAWVFTQGHDHE